MLNISVRKSTIFSIIVQLLIGVISIYGLTIEVQENDMVLNEILTMETVVQFIELCFYIYLLYIPISNMAMVRYFDWVFTTPTMLLTIILYFEYNKKEKRISFIEFVKENYSNILLIFICNWCMLLLGYCGEIGIIPLMVSILGGFIFFIINFYVIYIKYALPTKEKWLFYFITIIWALYGIAALLNPVMKNNLLNILDIFSKNILGLFIFYQITQRQLTK